MNKKQNRDPNRSTQTSYNQMDKKHTTQHNSSLNTISSTQQYLPASKQNKNSQILAEIKQSKNLITSKQSKQPAIKTNLSTTRSNYKPKFILKDLMQQKDLQSQEIDSESMCEEYFIQRHQENNNMSNTFNNSPLTSEAYYRMNGKNFSKSINGLQSMQARNKSVMLSKRSYLEDESKRNQDHQNTKQYDMPLQTRKHTRKSQTTQQVVEDEQSSPEFYQEASTVQYKHKPSHQVLQQPSNSLSFQPRIRSISTSNHPQTGLPTSPKNYKVSYLQTKKQLQIRSAYFNEAIQLCRHIIGNMKGALEQEYCENESDRVMWCHERCEDMLQVFEEWKRQ